MAKKAAQAAPALYKGVDLAKVAGYTLPKRMGDSSWFKLSDKYNNEPTPMRLLPPMGEMEMPWVDHFVHYKDGRYNPSALGSSMWKKAGEERDFGITCLTAHDKGECPVCKLIEWAKEEKEEDLVEALTPQLRTYANIVLREDGKVYQWDIKKAVILRVQTFFASKAGDICHPTKGRDIIVMKRVTGKRVRYECDLDLEQSPIDIEGWEQDALDMTKVIKFREPLDIVKILSENLGMVAPIEALFGVGRKRGK